MARNDDINKELDDIILRYGYGIDSYRARGVSLDRLKLPRSGDFPPALTKKIIERIDDLHNEELAKALFGKPMDPDLQSEQNRVEPRMAEGWEQVSGPRVKGPEIIEGELGVFPTKRELKSGPES